MQFHLLYNIAAILNRNMDHLWNRTFLNQSSFANLKMIDSSYIQLNTTSSPSFSTEILKAKSNLFLIFQHKKRSRDVIDKRVTGLYKRKEYQIKSFGNIEN